MQYRSGLELIASKWAHSLIEFDLAWANVQQTIDNALRVFAEKGSEAAIRWVIVFFLQKNVLMCVIQLRYALETAT